MQLQGHDMWISSHGNTDYDIIFRFISCSDANVSHGRGFKCADDLGDVTCH